MNKLLSKLGPMSSGEEKEKQPMHPMLLLVIILILCVLISYIIPAGTYERTSAGDGTAALINAGSFMYIERSPASAADLLISVTMGLQRGSAVIFFLLIIGGMFAILNGTGALNVGIANMLKKLKGKEILIIPIMMVMFGCGSAFCGNFEEYLVFIPLILACCITIGYDSLTAVGIVFAAAAAGYAGAITNSFTIGTAQEIAGLPGFSGMGLRIVLFVVLISVSVIYIMWYASMIRKNPRLSGAYQYDQNYNQDKKLKLESIPHLTVKQAFTIAVFILGIGFAIWGVIENGFYVDELSAIFLAVGIAGGLIGGLGPTEICEKFVKGCRDMLLPGLMIGLANSVIIILENSNILDTILHWMAGILLSLPTAFLACGMFIAHDLFNVIVPSGSAQANITMPLMIPLADAGGITRQTAVLAYQLGDAFTNVLAPTGGEILAALAICRVPFGKWVKFLLPLFILWVLIAVIFLIYATQIGYM